MWALMRDDEPIYQKIQEFISTHQRPLCFIFTQQLVLRSQPLKLPLFYEQNALA